MSSSSSSPISRQWRVVLSVTLGVLLLGCSDDSELTFTGNRTFAIVLNDEIDPWANSFAEEMQYLGEERAVIVQNLTEEGDSFDRLGFINGSVQNEVAALFIRPIEGENLNAVLAPTKWKKTVVFAIGEDFDCEHVDGFIGIDHVESGRVVAKWIKDKVESARIAVLGTWEDSTRCRGNALGFEEEVNEFDSMSIVWQSESDISFDGGSDAMRDLMLDDVEVNVIFALDDVIGMGAYETARDDDRFKNCRWITMGGYAGPAGGCQAVLDGKLDLTVRYPTGAKIALDNAIRLLGSEVKPERTVTLDPILITRENANRYDAR